MNIVLVGDRYPANTGIDSYSQTLAQILAARGNTVHLLVRTIGEAPVTVDSHVLVHQVKPIRLLPYAGRRFYFGLFAQFLYCVEYALGVAQWMRSIGRAERIDLVEAPECAAPGCLVPRLSGVPLVVRLHLALSLGYGMAGKPLTTSLRLISAFEGAGIRQAAAITAPSCSVAELTSTKWQIDPKTIRIIDHPLDPSLLTDGQADQHLREQVVLFVGSLSRLKGADTLLEAAPMILRDAPAIRFVFLGGDTSLGPSMPSFLKYLQQRARTLGVEDSIQFKGSVERDEVLRWYRTAAICAVPSVYESASLVCREAMACGIAVVASKVGAIPELIQDRQNGLLVPPKSPIELATAIVDLLSHPELATTLSRNAMETVRARCEAGRIAAETLDIYRSVREIV